MSKEYIQKLASDKKHIRHVTLEFASNWLATNAERVVETEQENASVDEDEESESYDVFYEPLSRAIEKLAEELKEQAGDLQKDCICYYPDDKRVYPAVSALLSQLPLPFSSSFKRGDDEGYSLEVRGNSIFRGLSADEAFEATLRYVLARAMNPDLLPFRGKFCRFLPKDLPLKVATK